MVKLRWLKNWKIRKIGDISNVAPKSAENFISQGYAEYVIEEPKKEQPKKEEPKEEKKEPEPVAEQKELTFVDERFVKEYSTKSEVIKFIKSKIDDISKVGAISLIKLLLWKKLPIDAKDIQEKTKTLIKRNKTKFSNEKLTIETIKSLRRELNGFLFEISKNIPQYEPEKNPDFKIKTIDGQKYYVLDKMTMFEKVRQLVCDEGPDIHFIYNFNGLNDSNKTNLQLSVPKNTDALQKCQIQIVSQPIKFEYPIEYIYPCPQCGGRTIKKAYEVIGTNGRLICPGIHNWLNGQGESKSRMCKLSLNPDGETSITKDAYYIDICYEDEKENKHTASAITFKELEPGFYECVLYKTKNPKKTEMYQIMDTKTVFSNFFSIPKEKENENYIYTLQNAFDKYIKQQTGMEIYGLFPIKCALILQTLANNLNMDLLYNIQLVGSPSTGKSLILKYYSFLLNNNLNLSTNGMSVSIPGLRGTKQTITLMGKEQKIITMGHLGSYKSIHIDEAGENKTLVQNLKTFLLENNYGYDKAESNGVFNKRTAHINISENLDYAHVGQYRGSIRKAYKNSQKIIEGVSKPEWDVNWDLYKKLYEYNDNPYLYDVIKNVRIKYKQNKLFWIDNYEYPIHERFPFYFYLVNEKKDVKFQKIIKENVETKLISENIQLIRVLKSQNIFDFFKKLEKYKKGIDDIKTFEKVDKILEKYGLQPDTRMREFYYNLSKLSRIINRRTKYEDMDCDFVQYMIEKMNCKLDIADTADYKNVVSPNLESIKNVENQIENAKENKNGFGMPDDEF